MTCIPIYSLVLSFFLFFCIVFLCILSLSSVGSSLLLYPCKVQYAPLLSIVFMGFWGSYSLLFFPFNVSYRILFATLINKFYPGPPLSIVFLFLLLYLLIFLSLRCAEPSVQHYPGKVHFLSFFSPVSLYYFFPVNSLCRIPFAVYCGKSHTGPLVNVVYLSLLLYHVHYTL